MTPLNKRVKRETSATLGLDKMSRGRAIIVTLEPPDLVTFGWKGTRRRYTATVARLMQWTIQAHVEAQRRERKLKRKGIK